MTFDNVFHFCRSPNSKFTSRARAHVCPRPRPAALLPCAVHRAAAVILPEVWGLPYVTSAKFSDFLTTSPLLTVTNQLIVFLSSAIWGHPPSPHLLRTSYMEAPLSPAPRHDGAGFFGRGHFGRQ